MPGIVKRWPVAKHLTAVWPRLTDTECFLIAYSIAKHNICPFFLFQDRQSVSKKECYRRIMGTHPSGWPGCFASHASGSFSFSWLWLRFRSKLFCSVCFFSPYSHLWKHNNCFGDFQPNLAIAGTFLLQCWRKHNQITRGRQIKSEVNLASVCKTGVMFSRPEKLKISRAKPKSSS